MRLKQKCLNEFITLHKDVSLPVIMSTAITRKPSPRLKAQPANLNHVKRLRRVRFLLVLFVPRMLQFCLKFNRSSYIAKTAVKNK